MSGRSAIPIVLALCAACSGGGSTGDSSKVGAHLTVRSLATTQQRCDGTFAPGGSVEITDARFAPGIEVTLNIAPPSGASRTSILAADESGTIHTKIQLPQEVGYAYISANGIGLDGTQIDDTTGLQLLAPESACKG